MSDTQLTGGATKVWCLDGATTEEIDNAQAAFDAMADDIDTMLVARTNLQFVSASSMPLVDGNPAWGDSPAGRTSKINRDRSLIEQRYTILHETGHHVDRDKLTSSKRTTLMALMVPVATGWNAGDYWHEANECFGDSFPRVYAPATITRSTGKQVNQGVYKRQVPAANAAAFASAVGGAGAGLATTLAAAASIGATNIKVASVTGLVANESWIEIGATEQRLLTAVGTTGSGGTGLTFADPLINSYTNGTAVLETTPNDPTPGEVIDVVVTANTPNGTVQSYTFTGMTPNTSGVWQMRFYDGTAWGDWSDSVHADLTPSLAVVQFTATAGTLTPDLAASLSGANPVVGGIAIQHWYITVTQDTPAGSVVKWTADAEMPPASPVARVSNTYSGDPLSFDQTYKVVYSLSAGIPGAAGWTLLKTVTGTFTFTPIVETGPLITYNGNALDKTFKIDTQTPTFRLADRNSSTVDQGQMRLWTSDGATLLYDSGLVSFTAAAYHDFAVPANVLAWGLDIEVDGAVRVSGNTSLTDFNATKYDAHINAAPGAPSPVTISAPSSQVVKRPDGVWVATSSTPTANFPFRDTDVDLGYTEAPTRLEMEIRTLNDVQYQSSPYLSITLVPSFVLPELEPDTTYKVRARYDDSANVRSAFSNYVNVRYSLAPTLSSVTPAIGATITDPTPTFAWTFASDGGKAQASYRLTMSTATGQFYDSGLIASTDGSVTTPPFLIPNDTVVDWVLTVYDTDGLSTFASRSFLSAFTQPDPLTGLTATPDYDAKALLLEWDESLLPDNEFYAYDVFAKNPDGDFALVATITDASATSVYFRAAPHNTEVVIRVTQTNGYTESEPAETSGLLGDPDPSNGTGDRVFGYWLLTIDTVTELKNVMSFGAGDTSTRLEQMKPLSKPGERTYDIVLNWGSSGYTGGFTLYTNDHDLVQLLRRYKERSETAMLKTSDGDVRYVRLTATPDADTHAGYFNANVNYVEIGPTGEF